MTAQEILEVISKHYSEHSYAFEYWEEADVDSLLTEEQKTHIQEVKSSGTYHRPLEKEYILKQLGLGEVIEVDQYGGEGEGETWYTVKYFKDHDVYIRTDGYYQSYNGTEFENGYGYEVRPQQKTITVYEA